MMERLADHLGAPSHIPDPDLILLRLMGRPFQRPLDGLLGEEPKDILAEYLAKAQGLSESAQAAVARPFVILIDVLMQGHAASAPLQDLISTLPQDRRADHAFTIIRMLDETGLRGDPVELDELAQRFSPGPRLAGDSLSVYWQLVLSRFASPAIPDDRIPVCREMVMSDTFFDGPLITTAGARPFLYFGSIVPIIFDALRDREVHKQGFTLERTLPSLESAMRAGFASLYRPRVDKRRRIRHLHLMASQLEFLVAEGDFDSIAEATLRGAAGATNAFDNRRHKSRRKPPLTNMPFDDFNVLETGYSRGRYRRSNDALTRLNIDELLKSYFEPIRPIAIQSTIDPILATNIIPYSEGIYLLMWKYMLFQAGITLELKYKPWGEVVEFLKPENHGSLSFATWNDYIPADQRSEVRFLVSKKPLLTYNYYPLVVRRDILEQIVGELPEGEASAVLKAMTGQEYLIGTNFHANYPELTGRLKQHNLSLAGGSELEDIAVTEFDIDLFKPMTSDDAVEGLINANLSWSILGGVQAEYLTRRFPQSAVVLALLERPTPVHIWFLEQSFKNRDYEKVTAPLMEAWRQTRQVWKDADSADHPKRKQLQQWIVHLAYSLNHGAGTEDWRLRTPILTWEEIKKLGGTHDVLEAPSAFERRSQETEERVSGRTKDRPALTVVTSATAGSLRTAAE